MTHDEYAHLQAATELLATAEIASPELSTLVAQALHEINAACQGYKPPKPPKQWTMHRGINSTRGRRT